MFLCLSWPSWKVGQVSEEVIMSWAGDTKGRGLGGGLIGELQCGGRKEAEMEWKASRLKEMGQEGVRMGCHLSLETSWRKTLAFKLCLLGYCVKQYGLVGCFCETVCWTS